MIKIKGIAAKILKGGNTLDIKTKNNVRYNNGNFSRRIKTMLFLFFCNNAALKISIVSEKFIIDHRDPVRNPMPQSNFPAKVDASTTTIVRMAVAFTGIFKSASIRLGVVFRLSCQFNYPDYFYYTTQKTQRNTDKQDRGRGF